MSNDKKWNPGDVVKLKTGGWPMTVSCYFEDVPQLEHGVQCVWFEKRPTHLSALSSNAGSNLEFAWEGPKYGTFHQDALAACEPTK